MAKKNVDPKESIRDEKEEIRGIVHLIGRDVKGNVLIRPALKYVKGIGDRMAKILSAVVVKEMSISPDTPIGKLNDEQMDKLESIVKNPSTHGVPAYLLNRRKDLETGKDKHMLGNDLTYAVKIYIENEKNIYTWRGYRHAFGQKVRGQGTRTSGRKGLTVGVARTKVREAAAAAKKAETKPAAGVAKPAAGATPAAAKPAGPAAKK